MGESARECGPCNACCVYLKIDDPGLRKPPAERCVHWAESCGCGIYEARPKACREFFCGWLQFDWLDESWRPDLCGIMVRPLILDGVVAMVFLMTGGIEVFDRDEVAIIIGNVVASDIRTFIEVPGPPGHMGARADVGAILRPHVDAGDLAAIRRALLANARHALAHEKKKAVFE